MRVAFVGGGSGGHFYPLMAIAEAIRSNQASAAQLYYFGPEPYNKENLELYGITYVYCPAGKRRKYASVLNFFDTFKILFGVLVAVVKLFWIYPDVIMSKGSYTSVPIVIAAAFLRIPIVIHESDAVPGSANKFAARFARYIAISYDDVAKYFPENKESLTGIPIRSSFLTPIDSPHQAVGIPNDRPVLFVTGGSLGAERINTLILDSLDELLPLYTVVHQAGGVHQEAVVRTALARSLQPDLLDRYYVFGHLSAEKMSAAYSAASIVIARAGSTSIAEIAIKGKPSILIPMPEEVSHDQRTNAYAYARSGAASVIEEKNLTDGLLAAEVAKILANEALYNQMSSAAKAFTTTTAAGTLATTLSGIAAEH